MRTRILIILLILVSCTSPTGNFTEQLIKIGWMGPLTGDAAIIGIPNKEGIGLAIDKINSEGGIKAKN